MGTILIYSICSRFKNNYGLYNKPASLRKQKDLESASDVTEDTLVELNKEKV